METTEGNHNLNGDLITDEEAIWNYQDLERQLNAAKIRIAEMEAEAVKVEMTCVGLPGFDPDGPGDCGDRQVAAIRRLVDRVSELEGECQAWNESTRPNHDMQLRTLKLEEAIEDLLWVISTAKTKGLVLGAAVDGTVEAARKLVEVDAS